MSDDNSMQPPGIGTTVTGWVGIVLYLVLGFLYLTSGLVVPLPGLLVLWLVWLAGWFLVVRLFRTRRVWTPAAALVGAVFWWIYLSVGAALFDWSA